MSNNDITQEYLKSIVRYEDGKLISLVKRGKVRLGQAIGTTRNDGRVVVRLKDKLVLLYRMIFLYHHGYLPKYIDHINGNPSDDRIENLREATWADNCRNSRKRSGSYNLKGVEFTGSKYRSSIKVNYKKYELGYYKTPELAHEAYCLAADMAFGEFANYGRNSPFSRV